MFAKYERYNRFQDIKKQMVDTGFDEKFVDRAIQDSNLYLYEHKLNNDIRSCTRCKLACPNKVFGCGCTDSPLMIIGEGPGKDELATGVPLIGPAGTLLIMTLNSLRVYRGRVYMTNATKCNWNDRSGKLQTPDTNELETCRYFLMDEIKIVRPQVILAMGNPALRAVTGDYSLKISAERSKIRTLQFSLGIAIKVMPTWHPSYVIRQKGAELDKAKAEFYMDVRNALELAKEAAPYYDWGRRPLE